MPSALVLTGWLLLVAPRGPTDIFHPGLPISKWDHVASFPNREACEQQRDQMIVYIDTHQRGSAPGVESAPAAKLLRCISSDDPALAK
jgi:hypothetical protein